ncbi:protein kinase [Nonomuraea sp. NPDC048826]|uniref:serine/threonine-protein kinase n=1 Tax=Nonomuraea sp. NPDC048826 TaxID=3364347 RepID=UPI00371638E3
MLPAGDVPGYRVLDQAGQGGFAVVYRAHQERLDRVVALKVLSVDRVDSGTMRRFQRELRLTGRLTGHPNVVTVFDTGITRSGKPYIAMDFFEHGSLRDKVRAQGPLPVAEVLRTGVKLAGALAAVHDAGVLHGDIKPQNILVSRYGEPAIADFGVARVVDSSEISVTTHSFTPLHAAPEVLTGQPHSALSDLYSLGSTLYHLLAGQPAFHSATDPSIAPLMYRVLSVEPPPINRPDVPPPVSAAILRAMAKQPEQRYASARAFAHQLRRIQSDLGFPVTDLIGDDTPVPPRPGPRPATGDAPQAPSPVPPSAAQYGNAPQAPISVPPPAAPYGDGPGYGAFPAHAGPLHAVPAQADPGPGGPGYGGFPTPAQAGPAYVTPAPAAPVRGGAEGGAVRMRIVIGGVVATVALAGIVFAVWLSREQAEPVARPTATTASQTPTRSPGETGGAALAPTRVKVTADRGTLVQLEWQLPVGARHHPLVVQRAPVEEGEQALTPLDAGTTSTRVAGLKPGTGYCFLVGVPVEISANSKVAWSKPVCIRGARPQRG